MTNATPRAAALRPCPFCGCAMQFRGALWPSEGDTDGVIHAASTDCPLGDFNDGTHDGSIMERWNNQPAALAMEKALLSAAEQLRWFLAVYSDEPEDFPLTRTALDGIAQALAQWGVASEGQEEEKM